MKGYWLEVIAVSFAISAVIGGCIGIVFYLLGFPGAVIAAFVMAFILVAAYLVDERRRLRGRQA